MSMKGWHWLSHHRRLRYGDNREVADGGTLTVPHQSAKDGQPVGLCAYGLHASAKLHHAARYASMVEWSPDGYAVLTEVELGDDVQHGDDKSVSTSRKCLSSRRVHISVFVEYARWCARYAAYAYAADAARHAAYAARHAAYADAARHAADAARHAAYAAADAAQEQWWTETLSKLNAEGRLP